MKGGMEYTVLRSGEGDRLPSDEDRSIMVRFWRLELSLGSGEVEVVVGQGLHEVIHALHGRMVTS